MSIEQPVSVLVKEGPGRRAVLQALMAGAGASIAAPALAMSHDHPMHEALQSPAKVGTADRRASAPGYKPQMLDKHLFETLTVLAEAIVPGSTKAKAAEFIDALLAVETPATQRRFFTALGAMEGLAIGEHRKPWKSLTAAEQTALLTKASTAESTRRGQGVPGIPGAQAAAPAARATAVDIRDQFEHLKGWIAGAYYSTDMGMRELGWNGTVFFAQLPECGPSA
jgi:Gluconate 2-dehydrogenase subunit 3